jgi:hypothetical protein
MVEKGMVKKVNLSNAGKVCGQKVNVSIAGWGPCQTRKVSPWLKRGVVNKVGFSMAGKGRGFKVNICMAGLRRCQYI